jgi:hypothetical protein
VNVFNVIGQALLEPNPTWELSRSVSPCCSASLTYQVDLSYLIEALIPLCVEFDESRQLDAKTAKVIEDVAARVGEEQLEEMLVRWLIEGYDPESARP